MKLSPLRTALALSLHFSIVLLAVPSVQAAPVINTEPASVTNVAGTTATFTVAATGTGTLNYRWLFNGTFNGTTTQTLNIPNVSDSLAGAYTVVVTDTTGSITSSPPAILTVI